MGHENGGWMNEDQRAGDWPDVYVECDVCGNQRLRGEACGHCEREALLSGTPREMLGSDHRKKFDEAMARLDAEVAAHEGDDELVCPACSRPYALHGIGCPTLSESPTLTLVNETPQRVKFEVEALPDPEVPHGIDATTGLPLSGPTADPEPPAGKARFGNRLLVGTWVREGVWLAPAALIKIAAKIDGDAAEYDAERGRLAAALAETDTDRDRLAAKLADLRRKVEETVERLRYSVTTFESEGSLVPTKRNRRDVLDAEPFLAELDRIFGDRPAAPDSDHQPWPEHEPPHDRRERESARNEDSTGRVEGVDR